MGRELLQSDGEAMSADDSGMDPSRKRLPLIVFILLLVLLLMLVGIACACASDHPMQTVERALSAIPAAPALVEVWTYAFAAMLLVAFVVAQRPYAFGRASPQRLQRFLF